MAGDDVLCNSFLHVIRFIPRGKVGPNCSFLQRKDLTPLMKHGMQAKRPMER